MPVTISTWLFVEEASSSAASWNLDRRVPLERLLLPSV
jgi:hypothetical protein